MAKRLSIKQINEELNEKGMYLDRDSAKAFTLYKTDGENMTELRKLTGSLTEVYSEINSIDDADAEAIHEAAHELGLTMQDQFRNLEIFTKLLTVRDSEMHLQIVAGPPGIGKSYEIVDTLNATVGDRGYEVISGKSSAIEVYNTLFNNRTGVVLFDDCDSVFDTSEAVNILKAATQVNHKTGRRDVRWNTNTKLVEVTDFTFEGKVIVITNRDFAKSSMIKARPLVSRSYFVQFENNRDEILERTREIAKKELFGLTLDERMEVVDYIAQFESFTPDLRLYRSIADLRAKAKTQKFDWEQVGKSVIYSQKFLDDNK